MSILNYLQLQPLEPTDDGTISPLDVYDQDETIDLNDDGYESGLAQAWDRVLGDAEQDADKLTFSEE